MTAGAVGHHLRPQSRRKTVVTIFVTTDALARDSKFLSQSYALMTPRTSISGNCRGSSSPLYRRHNVVDAMAISADRGSRYTTGNGLPMNALHELRTLVLVTLAAGGGNVDLCDRRPWIRSREDVVAVMTVGTNGSAGIASRNGFCVHTLSIRKKGTVANAASLHHRFIAVTAAAGFSDVTAIDRRLRITRAKNCRHVAVSGVTIHASGCFAAALNCLRVKTVIVGRVYFSMKPGSAQVRKIFAWSVTALALKIW